MSGNQYLKFPLSISDTGPKTSIRSEHVREQIEQVLFTSPQERVFRPEFGVGIRKLVFEHNNQALRNRTEKQMVSSLTEALHGEVDPRTIQVQVIAEDATLKVFISYVLAYINKSERHQYDFPLGVSHG